MVISLKYAKHTNTHTHTHNIHLSIPQNDTEQKNSISEEKSFEI